MNYERRISALEERGQGSQADQLADAVVLLILKRGDEVDPAIVDKAKHLLDERPWHNGMPAPLTVRGFADAIGRAMTLDEVESLLQRIKEFERSKRETSHPESENLH